MGTPKKQCPFENLGSTRESSTFTVTNVGTYVLVTVTRTALWKTDWCMDQLTAGVYSMNEQYVLANIRPLSKGEYKSRLVSLHDVTDQFVKH